MEPSSHRWMQRAALTALLGLSACGSSPAGPWGASTDGTAGSGGSSPSSSATGGSGGQGGEHAPSAGPTAMSARFMVRLRPSAGQVTVDPLDALGDAPSGDRFADAVAAPAGTFTLSTGALRKDGQCSEGLTSKTVCLDVGVAHALLRTVGNVFVQVTAATDPATGTALENAGALDSDPSEFGLDPAQGLWKYTTAASVVPGVLGQAPDNFATRAWSFSSPEHADVDLAVRVVASIGYADYTFDFSEQPFVDACTGGATLLQPVSAKQALPFPFALYGVTSSEVVLHSRGAITLGADSPGMPAEGVALPNAAAPRSSIFAFWDDVRYGGADSALCTQTMGVAPNRAFVVTWRDMSFSSSADEMAHLTFSAILWEGSNRVDVVYDQMSGPTARAAGSSATVGVQDETGTAATCEFRVPDFSTGSAYAFVPNP